MCYMVLYSAVWCLVVLHGAAVHGAGLPMSAILEASTMEHTKAMSGSIRIHLRSMGGRDH